jgi:hypothetical protein
MPLLFYLPMIVWLGMFEAAQSDTRVPLTEKVRR